MDNQADKEKWKKDREEREQERSTNGLKLNEIIEKQKKFEIEIEDGIKKVYMERMNKLQIEYTSAINQITEIMRAKDAEIEEKVKG